MNSTNPQNKRRTELDILRTLAMIAVIVIHLCATTLKTIKVDSNLWLFLNCVHSSITWCVPVFVLISGYLFLKPEKAISIRDIYGKYIKHIAICFIFWSAVFQVFYYLFADSGLNWKGIISEFLIGPYPFWYLYMLVGLYMIVPFCVNLLMTSGCCSIYCCVYCIFLYHKLRNSYTGDRQYYRHNTR